MYRSFRLAGFAALSLTPAALLAHALLASGVSVPALGIEGGVVVAGAVALAVERDRAFAAPDAPEFDQSDATDALAVVAAALVTHALNVHAGLGPVVASAVVGLAAGVCLSDADVPAYCGSFVGMASPAAFPSATYLALAGLLSGAAFVAAKRTFAGFGGKLGTLALFGCATTAALTDLGVAAGPGLAWADARLAVPVAVAGAVVTATLSVRVGLGAVVGSALVGLVAGLGFPAVVPATAETLAAVAFCASFVGMSSAERLGGPVRLALAGAVCGVVFVAVSTAFHGAGGKLGTVAFASCVTVAGAEELLAVGRRWRR